MRNERGRNGACDTCVLGADRRGRDRDREAGQREARAFGGEVDEGSARQRGERPAYVTRASRSFIVVGARRRLRARRRSAQITAVSRLMTAIMFSTEQASS